MIHFANDKWMPAIRQMWKVCFEDTKEFMNLYFTCKYSNENSLVYFENDIPVASLQMLPYTMRFYGSVIPLSYISGACTLPEYRDKGYMKELLIYSFNVMQQRCIPLSILIPAEEWLYGFYSKYGYEQTFERGTEALDIKPIIDLYYNNPDKAYAIFNANFQQQDFGVLKTREDFDMLVQEYITDGCPPKYNLAGMARVIDARYLLSLYAKKFPEKNFTIKITDEWFADNNATLLIQNGSVSAVDSQHADIETDIRLLTRLLMGYRTNNLPAPYSLLFEQHTPVMNFMLE